MYLRSEIKLSLNTIDEVLHLGREAYRLADQISIPTLIIQGRDDELVNSNLTNKLLQRIPHSKYQEIGGGHQIIQENTPQRQIVTESILSFLGQLS